MQEAARSGSPGRHLKEDQKLRLMKGVVKVSLEPLKQPQDCQGSFLGN